MENDPLFEYFSSDAQMKILSQKINAFKTAQDALRRGIFARYSELVQEINLVKQENLQLKEMIESRNYFYSGNIPFVR